MEKNHLFCLTGISTENDALLKKNPFAIINVFIALEDQFPLEYAKSIADSSILMITWEPYIDDIGGHSILAAINNGKHDHIITRLAASCKSYGKPVLIRWGHEMNGDWYSWSGAQSGKDAELYKKTFRRIHGLFQKEGSDNVLFVFSINYIDIPRETWNRFENYYPGNDCVDFIGLDVYNWGNTQKWGNWFWEKSHWENPETLIKTPYERIVRMAPEKPILLSEVGTTSSGGNKQEWIGELFSSIKHKYTAIKGFVWFDYDKETDWGITNDRTTWSTYKKMTDDDYFQNTYRNNEIFR